MIFLIVIFCSVANPDRCERVDVEFDGSQLECTMHAEGLVALLAQEPEWHGWVSTGWRCQRGRPI